MRLMQRRHPQFHRPVYIPLSLNVLCHGRTESLPSTQQQPRGQSHSAASTDLARGALATLATLCRADESIAGCDNSTHLNPAPSPASNGSFTCGYDAPFQASMLDRSLTNAVLRSLAALVVPGAAMSPAGTGVARERCAGGRHIEKMDDSDNRRRRLFSGVFKLLQESAREDEMQGVERVGRCLGQEDTNLIWVRGASHVFLPLVSDASWWRHRWWR